VRRPERTYHLDNLNSGNMQRKAGKKLNAITKGQKKIEWTRHIGSTTTERERRLGALGVRARLQTCARGDCKSEGTQTRGNQGENQNRHLQRGRAETSSETQRKGGKLNTWGRMSQEGGGQTKFHSRERLVPVHMTKG